MSPAEQEAASQAWQHAHPAMMIMFSTIGTLVVVTLIVLLRWLVSKSAWVYHPGGATGFLKDEFVRWGAILIPYLALAIAFRIYVLELHPELNTPQTWGLFALCAIAFRLLLRRLPFVKAMGRHIDEAKAKAREAKYGAQG